MHKDESYQATKNRKPYYIMKHEAIWGIKPVFDYSYAIEYIYEKEKKAWIEYEKSEKKGLRKVSMPRSKKEIEKYIETHPFKALKKVDIRKCKEA